ncbi:MAG: sigma-70 family RNA polymerase sigma factor [Acidobacteria bacterium]|nr:sigma-70 family RNA polymerase sigma factor [Acidobacteriota bacterium]
MENNFSEPEEITLLLTKWRQGDKQALDKLVDLVYAKLHKIAQNQLSQQNPNHTLQPTALINEAYLRLANWQSIDWKNRAQFLAVTAKIMRNILVDYARKNLTTKRGGARYKISLDQITDKAKQEEIDLVVLDDALTRLSNIDPLQSKIVELRYFAGLSLEETAEALDISARTVSREWTLAKFWLFNELDNLKKSP